MTPTAPQREIWIASKAGGEDANRAFNEVLALTLVGRLDPDALAAALRALTERHESLRCSFTADGQRFTVTSGLATTLSRVDLSARPADARARELDQLLRLEVETPFDLERPPLHRASLIRLEPERHVFVFTAHHVICDGWSTGVLAHELAALYRHLAGRASAAAPPETVSSAAGLPPAPSFAAYSSAGRARDGTQEAKREEEFWLRRLAGELKPIDLPVDRPRPARRTYAARRLDLPFEPALLAPLRKLGAKAGCTFLSTFLGVVQVWLQRLTGQRDLVIGVPAAGQAASGAESLVGHCVNVLPVRADVDASAGFARHLGALKPVVLDAFDNQQVTFSALLRLLNVAFDPSRIPLVPVCFNLESGLGALDFGGLEVTYETVPRAFETFEVFINAVDHRDRLVLEWSYNTTLFEETTIRRWMKQLETIVAEVTARPETPLAQLDLLAPEEKESLRRLNETGRPVDGVPVHERVAARARERRDHAAVRFGGRSLSFGDLDRRANQLAHRLQRAGVRPRDAVGVFVSRSEGLPVALLGVLKTGASYVPMDPSYPADRLAMMAEDADVKLILTETELEAALPPGRASLCLDRLGAELGAEPTDPPAVTVGGEDCAYVLFTSGSTGRPKGVEVPHRALENFLCSMQREPGFGPDDRLLAVTTVSFDIAGLELFLPLVAGGTIVLADRAEAADPEVLASLLERHDVTLMQATPATWRMLIDTGWKGRRRLRALCGGEAMAPNLAVELGERVGELWNMYGPTETTIWSTLKKIERGGRVTIGHPIDNTSVYVLDADRRPVPVGATGEIWIGGQGVALGYRGRAELTAERFVDDPFVAGARMYRTGDLGRALPEGELECLGRGDSQIKLRGFRIELGEIEAAIERLAGVRKAVVKLIEKGQAAQLAAYWVADPGAPVDEAAARAHLQKILPPYMMPQHYVAMDEWPMTPAGKIDRKALPVPEASRERRHGDAGVDAFRDDVDVAVAEMWQELLGVGELELGDDFFALGGQSLLAVRFVAMVKDRLGVPLKLSSVFSASTLREVADAIRGGGGELERGAVMLRREPGATRVFFVCGVHLYRPAARALGPGFESCGVIVLADELLEDALRKGVVPKLDVPSLVAEYVQAIRRVQPQGPYHVAGVSFGGVLAYEIARTLREAGESVGLLALLDPILPSSVHSSLRQFLSMGARAAKKLLGPGAAAVDGADAADRLGVLRNDAYEAAIAEWDKTAPPYAGDAVLFRAADTSKLGSIVIAPDLGWRRLVRGQLDVHELPGSHIGILAEPNVLRLAALMREHLLKLEENGAAARPEPAVGNAR